MAIPKSRLGRGLGNLIAGGISGGAKPSAPAPKAAPAPAKKATAPQKGSTAAASKGKPAPKPATKATAPAKATLPVKAVANKGLSTKSAPKSQPAKPVAKPTKQGAKATPAAKPTKQAAQAVAATKPVSKTAPAPVTKTATPAPVASTSPAVTTPPASVSTAQGKTAISTPASQHNHAATPIQTQTTAHPAATARPTTATVAGSNPATAPSTSSGTPVGTTGSTPAGASTQSGTTANASTLAATSANAPAAPASPYREILVATVAPNPYQPRREMDPEHIAELANSIASEGLLQPIVVRPLEGGKGYELIAGERRWRAHQKLGLKTIAARVMDASDSSSAVISLIENIQRQALNPIEEALGFASLMRDFDLTQEAVSERIGRARASIANSLRLLALDREIQGYVSKGILSVGHAKILLGLDEPAQRLLIARRIIEGGMSVRETEVLVKRLKSDKHARPSGSGAGSISEADRTAISDLEKQISSRLNTKVQLRHTPKKGRIVIEYYGNEDLQRILERTGLQL